MSTSVVILQNEDKLANIEIIIIKHDYWRVFLLHVTRKNALITRQGIFYKFYCVLGINIKISYIGMIFHRQ